MCCLFMYENFYGLFISFFIIISAYYQLFVTYEIVQTEDINDLVGLSIVEI